MILYRKLGTTNITVFKTQIPPEGDHRVLQTRGPKLSTNLSNHLGREDKYKDMDPSLSLSLTESSNAPKRDKMPLNTKAMHQILRCHLRHVFLFHTYSDARLYLLVYDQPIQSIAKGRLLPEHRCCYLPDTSEGKPPDMAHNRNSFTVRRRHVNLNTLQNPFEPLNALGEGRKLQGHGTIENHITDTQTEALKPPESLGGFKRRVKVHMIIRHILRAVIPKPPSNLWTPLERGRKIPRMSNLLQNPQKTSQPHHRLKHFNPGRPVKKLTLPT
jgi:hypothetical protein